MEKGRRFFTILLIIVVFVTLGLLGYLAYDYISKSIIEEEASDIVDEFENAIITVEYEEEEDIPQNINDEPTPTPKQTTSSNTGAKQVTYKGYNVIGTIQIPKTNLKYPIVDSVNVAAMNAAISFAYGPGLNQVGNSVLMGHNYKNGGFFGNNKKLENGDIIYITDVYGNKISYTVYNKYMTSDVDFDYATRDTNGKREISLSTCTSDSSKRLVIWAKEN